MRPRGAAPAPALKRCREGARHTKLDAQLGTPPTWMCPDTASSLTPDSIHVWFSSRQT